MQVNPATRDLLLKLPEVPKIPRLTEKDMQVVRMILSGLSVSEISVRLNIPYNTIQNRIDRIARKLKVSGRGLIIAYIIVNGVISIEEARSLLKVREPTPEPY